jgi:hypothetical protein
MSSTVDVTVAAKASPSSGNGPPQGPVRSATHCGREHCGRLGAMQCDCYPAAKKEAEKEAEKQVAKLYFAVAAKAKKAEKQDAKASKAVIQKKPAKKAKIRHQPNSLCQCAICKSPAVVSRTDCDRAQY